MLCNKQVQADLKADWETYLCSFGIRFQFKFRQPTGQANSGKTGIEDPQKVTGYTQQAVDLIKQEATANPEGIESLFNNVLGGAAGDVGGEVKKSIGDRIKGFFGS